MASSHHILTPRPYPALLSLVIPAYNEAAVLPQLRQQVTAFLAQVQGAVEVFIVNDGSADQTLPLLLEWAAADRRIKVLHLSRNFGHQIAATAGLDHAAGDAVVLIDADLQDPLPVIHEMIARYREGYDVVYGQRLSRAGEGWSKRLTAWAFYRFMSLLIYRDLPPDVGDFRLVSRTCVEALRAMREQHRFLRGMVAWTGFAQTSVAYHRQPRAGGVTKYPYHQMLRFAWTAAISFSTLPLRLSFLIGVLLGLLGLEEAVRAVLARLLGWYTVPGWTSLMVVVCLIGFVLLTSLGVLGEYVGKIYEESKGRPLYFVARTANLQDESAQEHRAGRI